MNSNKFDLKHILIFVFILSFIVLFLIFRNEFLYGIDYFFRIPYLNIGSGLIAMVLTITHSLKYKKIKFTPAMSFNEFRSSLEIILSNFGSPITLVCSITLAKGIFFRYYNNTIIHFPLFNDTEIFFIGLVTAYLLYISIMELVRFGKEIFMNVEVAEPKK